MSSTAAAMAWPPLIRATGPFDRRGARRPNRPWPMKMHDDTRLLIASEPGGGGTRLLSVMWMVGPCGKTGCIRKRHSGRGVFVGFGMRVPKREDSSLPSENGNDSRG